MKNLSAKNRLNLSSLQKFGAEKKYTKNRVLIETGDDSDYLFYLKSGYVRVYVISREGKELTLQVLRQTAIFPLISAFSGKPNIYAFETLTNATVQKIPKKIALDFIKANPDLYYEIMKLVIKYLDVISRVLIDSSLSNRNAPQQLASAILYLTRYFSMNNHNGEKVLSFPITHRILGSLAGLARETTSRELSLLMKSKVIEIKKHNLIIKNLKQLEEQSLSHLSLGQAQ